MLAGHLLVSHIDRQPTSDQGNFEGRMTMAGKLPCDHGRTVDRPTTFPEGTAPACRSFPANS